MVDKSTLKTMLLTVATLAMGFYFGSQYTGRKAQETVKGTYVPEWIQHVRSVQTMVLAVFAVSLLAVVVIDYQQHHE